MENTDTHAVRISNAGATLYTSNEVSFEELHKVPLPEKTDTYIPVSYPWLVNTSKNVLADRGFELKGEKYGLSCKGKRMVAMLEFTHPEINDPEMGFFWGLLSSYDKSTANVSAMGGKVFVCENTCVSGDLRFARRHTLNVKDDFLYMIGDHADQSLPMFTDMTQERDMLKTIDISHRQGFHLLGEILGEWGERGSKGFLSPNQVTRAVRAWKSHTGQIRDDNQVIGENDKGEPIHKLIEHPFAERNLWSWYQACNEALKTTAAHDHLGRHAALHRFAVNKAKEVSQDMLLIEAK
jgi:hypothetical protein